jgi:hypothetical protein
MIWQTKEGPCSHSVEFEIGKVVVWFSPDQYGRVRALYCGSGIKSSRDLMTDVIRVIKERVLANQQVKRFGTRRSSDRKLLCMEIAKQLNAALIFPQLSDTHRPGQD